MSACGTTAVPRELRDAREAVAEARGAAEADPADVRAAASELADAEGTWRRLGDVAETRDLALVAARRARIAVGTAARRAATKAEVCATPTLTSAKFWSAPLGDDEPAVDRIAATIAKAPANSRIEIRIPDSLAARDRAAAVRAALVARGIAASRITIAESAGTQKPSVVVLPP